MQVHELVIHLPQNVAVPHSDGAWQLALDRSDWMAIHKNQHEIRTVSHDFHFCTKFHLPSDLKSF
jgi:hypothetical protein